MSTAKKSQPITENTTLPAHHAEVEDELDDHPSGDTVSPNHGFFDHERKLIALEESEARYRRLFETAKDGILILDGDTARITDVNPFLQDMLGYSKSELVGKALWEIGPVKDIAASQEAMRHLQHSEYIRYDDLPLETKTGERKQVEFVSNVYLVNGWRVIQCNIRDITARKHAETRVQMANDELLTLVDELQWRDREMQLLNHMNELLQSCMTQTEAYQVITLTAEDLFPGYSGCLSILHATDLHLEVVARWGTEVIIESTFSVEDCWALRRGQLHEVVNPQAGLLCHHFIHSPKAGYLCLPLTVRGETIGILCLLDSAIRKGKHQLSLQQLAMTVGETIKLSLSNLKLRDELRQQAIHDPLTGLFNRRYLDETLPRELHMAQRRKAPLCILMLDLDGFKQFNDSFGHGPGDSLLREFGRVLGERLRKSDISCRYGGDEFVLVLPDSSIADTQERMEQIRIFLKGLPIHYGEQMFGMLTLSAGIAQSPEHGTTANELLRAADEAMYAAKRAGRDRTVIYRRTGSPCNLPQVTEADTPQTQDAPGEYWLYHKYMTRVYVADAKPEERSALRLLLLDLKMEVAGEAADWATTLAHAPVSRTDILLIDWDMLPRTSPSMALDELRRACPAALVIILISHLDARQQAALSSGADAFISKGESPERVAERLRAVAASVRA